MENAGYFFAAYTLIWALVFGYVLFLVKRQAALKRELDSLKPGGKEESGKA